MIGASIGEVEEVGVGNGDVEWGEFLRVRVRVDITKPLPRGVWDMETEATNCGCKKKKDLKERGSRLDHGCEQIEEGQDTSSKSTSTNVNGYP
ncbi:hypothetical protein MRB53_002131 [Persea americana]|uniref:Uncharacterized protein n=1 Tax=Persea americana TaxID=3435 RepID=A0ACC2MUL0_PERAE|nr:hypothetical protein MRB53_002131 [Persea americana]